MLTEVAEQAYLDSKLYFLSLLTLLSMTKGRKVVVCKI